MDLLNSTKVFLEVANQKGFAPAAKKLNISTSAASRHVKELEEWLNIKLIHRTTRTFNLTTDGKACISKCEELIERAEELKTTHINFIKNPEGRIRATMPHWIAETYLCPRLPAFKKKYPNIFVELVLADQPVNIEKNGFDVSVGCGLSKLKNSSLIAKKISDDELFLVASPEYLAKNGAPKSIKELHSHNCIIDNASPFGNRWPLKGSKKSVSIKGGIVVNSGPIAKQLVLDGAGISLLPKIFISRELEEDTLVPFLKSQINFKGHLYLIHRPLKRQSEPIKLFVNFALKCLENISYH